MYRVYMYALSGPPVTVISKNLSEEQETEVKQSKTAWACSDECTIRKFTYFLIFLSLNLGKNLIPFYDHQFSDVFGLI